jgi:uncharacterized protein YgbK (DUF1537 family)
MRPVKAVVIADDLSGAVAVGADFRKAGRNVLVVESGAPYGPDVAEVLVVNTDSRDDDPQLAARKTRGALRALTAIRPDWLLKKIDSLLRGHIGAEIAAVLAESGRTRCLVAPAAPRSGRTTIQGRQCFAGRSLCGQMRDMDDNAVLDTDDVLQVLARETDLPARLLPLELVRQGVFPVAQCIGASTEPLLIADAETQEDLNVVVAAAAEAGVRFVAGTYGAGEAVMLADADRRLSRPILAVAGSTSLMTHTQAAYAGARSCALVTLFLGGEALARTPGTTARPYRAELLDHLRAGRNVVLRTYADASEMRAFREAAKNNGWEPVRLVRHVEACIAAIVRPALGHVGGIAISGGATASAIFRSAGATSFVVEGPEVLPASPVLRIADGKYKGLPCLTKPGAFGEESDLLAMIRFLRLHAANGDLYLRA